MPGRRTAPLRSQIPVGQPPCIFDVGKHKFDGTLYRSRSHTLHPCFQFYRYLTSMTPFHTHCICYVFLIEISSTHCLCFAQTISLTPTHVRTCTKRRSACRTHVLTSHSQPHPRGYTVEFVSVRKGSPRDNLTRVAVVYSKEGRVPRLDGTKFDLTR